MLKILKTVSMLSLVLLPWASFAKGDKAPADFKLIYRSSAGEIAQATQEQVEVGDGKVAVTRRAKPIGSTEMRDETRSYDINSEQLAALWAIVRDSGFMTWPNNPETPRASRVEESFEVRAKGKTVTHGRWEQGNQEAFRILFEKYNSWFNGVRTVRF